MRRRNRRYYVSEETLKKEREVIERARAVFLKKVRVDVINIKVFLLWLNKWGW